MARYGLTKKRKATTDEKANDPAASSESEYEEDDSSSSNETEAKGLSNKDGSEAKSKYNAGCEDSIAILNEVADQKTNDSAASSKSEDEEDDLSSNDGTETEAKGNAGWADSIAKVLNTTKPKSKKTLVLSRAKKNKHNEKEAKITKDYGFEIDGEIKEENQDIDDLDVKPKQRKNLPLTLRVKPTWKDMERERALRKIATRGVVQLFNAVRMQQKDLKEQLKAAGPLDSRKEAVLNNINKRKFLDVLMGGNRAKSEQVDNAVKFENKKEEYSSDDADAEELTNNGKKKAEWNVFRDDFMTNKKIKHWDEEDDNSDENNAAEGSDDDSDEDD